MIQALILDDDPMVTSIHRRYLEMHGGVQIAACCANGRDGLRVVERQAIDLAIVDVYMPQMDGVQFVRELRARNCPLDVIMVTAANDAEHIRQFMALGVLDYLVKPFEYARFAEAIDRYMKKRAMLAAHTAVSQNLLDSLFAPKESVKASLRKGMQEKTLDFILDYMREHERETMTSEQIAAALSLSRVTIRRYMNYLIEQGKVESMIDYSTGGRPSILYRFSEGER